MSTTDKSPFDENEWQAQERGMRAASGRDADGLDAVAARYRVVAGSLASMPRNAPPADFAAGVAKRVARREAGLERALSRILLAAFAVASLVAGLLYGGQWWQSLHQAFGDDALGWMLAGMGCVALSWVFSRLLERATFVGEPGHAS